MGNSLSLIMLAGWPAVAAMLFSRLEPRQAAIWTVLLGYLLLPPVVGINLPVVPLMDKHGIPILAATAGILVMRDRLDAPFIRMEGWVIALLAIAVITPLATVATNPEPLVEGITYRPGLGLFDALNAMVGTVLMLLPFVLGYLVLSTGGGIRAWMLALLTAGLAYSLPMLIEVRVSPQLNVWIYGFFAHDFSQSIRYGGYRPMVFLEHGLWVAIFVVMVLVAALVSLREAPAGRRLRLWGILLYLLAVLILCKSVASIVYGILLVPVILLVPTRVQVLLAAVTAGFVLIYPLTLWVGLAPTGAIRDFAMSMDPERGRSLEYRLMNEEVLLERAALKPLAGWGGWGRNLEIDPISGQFTTVTDGFWVVILTINGIMGYLSVFGLLCGSVIRIWLTSRGAPIDRWTAGLALVMAANLVDLIPNATVTPLTWLSMGALAGLAARGVTAPAEGPAGPAPAPRHPPLRALIGGVRPASSPLITAVAQRPRIGQ